MLARLDFFGAKAYGWMVLARQALGKKFTHPHTLLILWSRFIQ